MMDFERRGGSKGGMQVLGALVALCVLTVSTAPATVFKGEVIIADITTRAVSVVWVSDAPVTKATVRVFGDANGTMDITASLTVTLVSALFPPALLQGIVKVQMTGLTADTRVFIQTETTGAGGTSLFPAAPPFIEIHTTAKTTKANAQHEPIVNDLIIHDVFAPPGAVAGTLLVVDAPGLAVSPLTAFVGEGFPAPTAVVDLNNLFDAVTRASAEVPAGVLLRMTEFRGLRCPLTEHQVVRFRRVPAHAESPPITELASATPCFFADTVCDDEVNILDAQRVLHGFNTLPQDCVFNPDLDIVSDNGINILDLQSVLNRFGERAPFTP